MFFWLKHMRSAPRPCHDVTCTCIHVPTYPENFESAKYDAVTKSKRDPLLLKVNRKPNEDDFLEFTAGM